MNIAFFNSIQSWGGGEKWHFETSVYFSKLGYNVFFFGNKNGVIADKLNKYPSINFISVVVKNLSFINIFKVYRLKKAFKENKIDVLIINHPADLKLASHAASLAGVKKIIYRRGSAIPIKNSRLNRYIFKNWTTDILANSNATKETILENNKNLFPKDKIKVIYNHFDIEKFENIEINQNDFIPEEKHLIIGNLGRLAYQKNQKFLIDLSSKLKQENFLHTIYIAGTGELEKELHEYSIKKGTSDTVKFIGFKENVKNFLTKIDIFILPSFWEGFGYVLAEAALCKKPVIAFDISSNPELVLDKKSGFLIEKNNIDETIIAIKNLQDKNLRDKFGQVGEDYCKKTFDKSIILKQLEEYFNS